MTQISHRSLQKEINTAQLIVTLVILATCSAGFILNNYYLAESNLNKTVESTGYVLAQNVAAPLMFQDTKEATSALNGLLNHPILSGGLIRDAKGNIFAAFPKDILKLSKELRLADSTTPILVQKEKIGSLTLFVRRGIQTSELLGYGLVGIVVLLVGFGVAQVISYRITLKITNQLSRLLNVIQSISEAESYELRVIESTSSSFKITELLELSLEFDRMLTVIQNRNRTIHELNQGLELAIEKKKNELQEAQASLVQSSKLSALGEMAAGIAHEVNNPLAIISLSSKTISNLIASNDLDREKLNKNAVFIQNTVERISKIIKGLKTFSRDGSQDPFEICKLKSIIESALEICQMRFKNNKISLEIADISPELSIFGSSTQLGQVILNFLNNAHDAVSPLEDKWVKLSAFEQEGFAVIVLTDSGSGIPKEIQAKIMQPFFTTKGVGKGTGLGLSISKGIVESHKGSIEINSSSPHTEFIIKLPIRPTQTVT